MVNCVKAVVVVELRPPMPILPLLSTWKSVDVPRIDEEPMANSALFAYTSPKFAPIENFAYGDEVPTPTLPVLSTINWAAELVLLATTKPGPEPRLVTESWPYGDVVEMPTLPLLLTPVTISDGLVEPWLDTTNAGLSGPISTENLPHGLEVPTPTRPLSDERVEIVSVGTLVLEVAKSSARSMPLGMTRFVVVPKVKLPALSIENNVVVAFWVDEATAKSVVLVEPLLV